MFWENLRLALTGLKTNKMRSFLTMLGIIIGIGAVITIMTLGDSVKLAVSNSMSDLGVSNLVATLQAKEEDELSAEMNFYTGAETAIPEDSDYLTDEMLSALVAAYPEQLRAFSITETVGGGTVDRGALSANVNVSGVSAGFFVSTDLELLAGRALSSQDFIQGKKVCLVSDRVTDNLFAGEPEAAIGCTLPVTLQDGNYYTYTVVGVYKYVESAGSFSMAAGSQVTTSLYLPLRAAQDQLHSNKGYLMVTLVLASGTDSTSFAATAQQFLNNYYRNNRDFQVKVISYESMVQALLDMMNTISTAIMVIAAISLLVGGIGVMNIMLVSITERTREIGTCKALGAPNSSIRMQFIAESIIICLIGGAIGILLGIAGGALGAKLLGFPATASIKSIVGSLLFSMAVGVFFGYYPANKAAKMDPIEALRYE